MSNSGLTHYLLRQLISLSFHPHAPRPFLARSVSQGKNPSPSKITQQRNVSCGLGQQMYRQRQRWSCNGWLVSNVAGKPISLYYYYYYYFAVTFWLNKGIPGWIADPPDNNNFSYHSPFSWREPKQEWIMLLSSSLGLYFLICCGKFTNIRHRCLSKMYVTFGQTKVFVEWTNKTIIPKCQLLLCLYLYLTHKLREVGTKCDQVGQFIVCTSVPFT